MWTMRTAQRKSGLLLLVAMFLLTGSILGQELKKMGLLDLQGKWWKVPKIVEEAKLTPTQVEKIENIFLEHKKNLIDLKARLEKDQLDFQILLSKETINRDNVLAKLDQISETRAQITKQTVVMQMDIYDLLSPEQRSTLEKIRVRIHLKQLRHRMERRQDHRSPGPPRNP